MKPADPVLVLTIVQYSDWQLIEGEDGDPEYEIMDDSEEFEVPISVASTPEEAARLIAEYAAAYPRPSSADDEEFDADPVSHVNVACVAFGKVQAEPTWTADVPFTDIEEDVLKAILARIPA